MQIRYNVSGERRKEMVKAVSESLYGCEVKYLGAPSFSYQVGILKLRKTGL